MERDWIKVFTSTNFYQAEIIKQMLESHDMESVLLNRQDSSHKTFGEIEVYVHREDFAQAIEMMIANQLDTSEP